ncbi:MAG: type III polyketide synthase [Pseudolabrys sp.]|jgi:alkylresorcinol/alkylpyrone synthase
MNVHTLPRSFVAEPEALEPLPVGLLSLATAAPPYRLAQDDVARLARRVYARAFERFPNLNDVFVNAGIEQRQSVRPLEWFEAPHDFAERGEVYLDGASRLFVKAAREALDHAALRAEDIDVVVTVSSTGIATPSLEARVATEMGFRPNIMRVPLFGLGCAGGVSGLAIGARLARAHPGETVLVVVVELCTVAFRSDRGFKADIISSALFGDGAAAMVLRADSGRDGDADVDAIRLGVSADHTWPGSLDIMGWTVDPTGLGVVLSRSVPHFVEKQLPEPARRFVEMTGFEAPNYVLHPGGAKVLDALEAALQLQSGSLLDERAVLRAHGNMSAATVMFVLASALRRGLRGPTVMAAMGPGFTATFMACQIGAKGKAVVAGV